MSRKKREVPAATETNSEKQSNNATLSQADLLSRFARDIIAVLEKYAAKQAPEEDFVSADQLAKVLGVHRVTVNRWCSRGMPYYKKSLNSKQFKLSEVRRWLDEQRQSDLAETSRADVVSHLNSLGFKFTGGQ